MSNMSVTVDPFAVEDPSELLDWRLAVSFMKPRHQEAIKGEDPPEDGWRMKERMKTWSVALCLCLNIGVDPPDVVKTNPCARKEAWIDPQSMSAQKALEQVGNNLQKQYERWQPRARYKQLLDPTTDDVRKLCIALRKNAKNERVLFHYNGHGVPKPTQNGEIWVFNKNYTQYIPLSVYDLQAWMGSPSIYVYDCSHAGLILDSFKGFARQRDSEFFMEDSGSGLKNSPVSCVGLLEKCIQMAACSARETLPMNPHLPADLFSACLTTPIKTALLWFLQRKIGKLCLVRGITEEIVEKIPGRLNDRRSPLGELNWIFTAITDTIAWNSLPRDLFQKLFRQDLLVASLFRNFLLAERIMRSFNCTPESHPTLPPTFQHPMWQAWDLALDHILAQIPALLDGRSTYETTLFFPQQLSAFQVWLMNCSSARRPPEQLPIVLQFLLSQAHRLQALELLGRFLDLGPWAVHAALSVGVFPYVLKLLGSKLKELQPILVFIWSKILAVDQSSQADLVKDGGYKYFVQILRDSSMQYEYRTMAAFVLSVIAHKYLKGQDACLKSNVISLCLEQLEEPNPVLKQWLAVCLGRLWEKHDGARWCGVRDSAHEKLYGLLWDEVPEVRAAAVFALGTYILNVSEVGHSELATSIDHSVAMTLLPLVYDGSAIVRKELVVTLHGIILIYEKQFQIAALRNTDTEKLTTGVSTSVTAAGWIHVSIDPPEVESSVDSGDPAPCHASSSPSSASLRSTATKSLVNGSGGTGIDRLHGDVPVNSKPSPSQLGSSGSSSSVGSDDQFLDSLPKRGPATQTFGPTSLGGSSSTSRHAVYSHVWKGMIFLASDPHPEVAQLSQCVIHSVHDKLRQKSQAKMIGATLTSSHSSPSSPVKLNSLKSATLGAAGGRSMTRQAHIQPSSSTQEFRVNPQRPDISLPRYHFGPKRTIFGRGPSPEEDDDGADDQSRELHTVETAFIDWCSKYFANPLMKQPEDGDPASVTYQRREYRFMRNHIVRSESTKLNPVLAKCKLSDQIFVNRESKTPQLLKFHPYVPHLAVMHKNRWSIWDIEQGTRLVTMATENYSVGRITAAEFINPHDTTFLLTGSDDGSVHVWRNYLTEEGQPELITAWRALTDMLPATRNAGMVLEWEQATGLLYAAGDVRHIRAWDSHKELKIQDIPTGADSCVTCLASDSAERSLMIAGCGDGTVRLYDRRMPPTSCLVQTLREHSSWVVNVHLQQHTQERSIVSCSVGGDVRIWDPRFMKSVRSFTAPASLNACAIHPRSPLIACASPQQAIRIYNIESEEMLNNIRYHDGFMGQRIGPTKCLAFHPYKMWLAAGGTDGLIAIYSTERKKG